MWAHTDMNAFLNALINGEETKWECRKFLGNVFKPFILKGRRAQLQRVGCTEWLPSEECSLESREKVAERKPGRHPAARWPGSMYASWWQAGPLIWCVETALCLRGPPASTHSPTSSWERRWPDPNREHPVILLSNASLNCQGRERQGKPEKPSQPRGDQWDRRTEHSTTLRVLSSDKTKEHQGEHKGIWTNYGLENVNLVP